ncbi:Bullous pemphigoid antigen isoforms 6 9 10 [Chlorella sorokiniana]|uniref:Bullous pemphigoid antigen isoforms 6 9 10 n=1 Tax=Chlorella sorokiniana TaxID=3076 RepID=A0A2P6U3G4_CHLSO|nr:Bullous pemphigoid antigen isoforms 6 9 10 [Chlorella sorokiniana]|eukprot:PRW60849.1 Bullous pemphigoid antigen isoforms 6 9 10 [Chlorella sorokiniana]
MEGQQDVQPLQEAGALEGSCSEQEGKLLRIVRQGFSRLLVLDAFLRLHFFALVARGRELRDPARKRVLGPREMAVGDEQAQPAGLAMEAFATLCGLRPVSVDTYGKLSGLLSTLCNLLSPYPAFCKLAFLLAQRQAHLLAAEEDLLPLLEEIGQALQEYAGVLEGADNMIRPVMTLQAVLDSLALYLGALRLEAIYAEALLGRLRSLAGSSDPAASQEVGLQASQLFDCLGSSNEDAEAWRHSSG